MVIYVVAEVDYDTERPLKAFKTQQEAEAYIENELDAWNDNATVMFNRIGFWRRYWDGQAYVIELLELG